MEKFEQQLNTAKGVRMSPDEKGIVRYNLSSFIDKHPAKAIHRAPATERFARISPYSAPSMSHFFTAGKILAFALILVMVSGGTLAFAAENALPGDVLYPIKINVNEPIRGALAVTPEEKADWQATRVERRLSEISILSGRNALTADRSALVQNLFENETDDLKTTLTMLDTSGKASVAQATLARLLPILNASKNAPVPSAPPETAVENPNTAGTAAIATPAPLPAIPAKKPDLTKRIRGVDSLSTAPAPQADTEKPVAGNPLTPGLNASIEKAAASLLQDSQLQNPQPQDVQAESSQEELGTDAQKQETSSDAQINIQTDPAVPTGSDSDIPPDSGTIPPAPKTIINEKPAAGSVGERPVLQSQAQNP